MPFRPSAHIQTFWISARKFYTMLLRIYALHDFFQLPYFLWSTGKQPAIGCQHLPHSFCKAAVLTDGDVEDTFQDCYQDSNKERQDAFIMSHFSLSPVMRQRGNGPQPKRQRNYAPAYHVGLILKHVFCSSYLSMAGFTILISPHRLVWK